MNKLDKMADTRKIMKKILLEKATDKEILEEVMKRRGVKTDKEWKLMLMDTETLNEIKKRMSFSKMTKTEIGKL